MDIKNGIEKVVNKKDLLKSEAETVMGLIMSGKTTPTQIGSFLTALRLKGETIEEIAAFASVMRDFCAKITPSVNNKTIVDTCGTGGDKIKTFNVSTISAFIVAGAGIPVAKHGNRSVTSKCGSADLLEGIGVNIVADPATVEKCIEKIGIGFMFAPVFHPAMKHAIGPRREMGIRTVFNILGPLTNPANAKGQVMGVYDLKLTDKLSRVLQSLDVERAFVVHGLDGIDEISTTCKTRISELKDNSIETYTITPEEFGIKRAKIADIQADGLEKGIRTIFQILKGEDGSATDMVLLNSAAAIVTGKMAENLQEGLEIAKDALKSGNALKKARELVKESKGDLKVFSSLEEKF